MPRPSRALSILSLVAALTVVGCDSNDDTTATALLEFGTTSTFVRTFGIEGEEPVFTDRFDVTVAAEGQTVAGQSGLVEVTAESGSIGQTERIWYRPGDDALTEVAYACPLLASVSPARLASGMTSLLRPLASVGAKGARQSCTGEPVVWDEPRLVFRLPLRVGSTWRWSSTPFLIERRVTGEQTVTVGAGTYRTSVVETTVDTGSGVSAIEWTDYVSAEVGLVLRVMVFESEATDEHGTPTGAPFRTVDRIERVES